MVPTSICDSNISTHPLVSTEQFLPALHLHLHPIWGGVSCALASSNSSREILSVCSKHAGMQFHAKRIIKVKSAAWPASS